MTNRTTAAAEILRTGHQRFARNELETPLSFLHLVTRDEMSTLAEALARGHVPADLEAKLNRLAQGDLLHQAVARHCRLFIVAAGGLYWRLHPSAAEHV